MKHSYLLLLIAAALSLCACDWFSAKKTTSARSIVGYWKLDSVGFNDSSGLAWAWLSAAKDSVGVHCNFTADSSYHTIIGKDTSSGRYELSAKQLLLKDGEATDTFAILSFNDSLLVLRDQSDSTEAYLRKLH